MIRVDQLSKRFRIYDRPLDRLYDWLTPGSWHRGREFWALRDLNFTVEKGASVGIVGVNGAGKSTLLKVLTGATIPTAGSYLVEGRIASLLELGTGFHPEFTGRQNIQYNGKLAGLSEAELSERFDAILAFAELGDFIDQPVRSYSSGMVLRLGFALASSVDPDVLIIDEALSVGDLHFQQKCLRRIKEFHERGVTVLFVSHDPGLIQKFCTEALLLDQGRMIDRGRPDQVLDYYTALLAEKYRDGGARTRILRPESDAGVNPANDSSSGSPPADTPESPRAASLLNPRGHRTGNFRAVITSVELRGGGSHGNAQILVAGRRGTLAIRLLALESIEHLTVGIGIRDRLGQEIYGVNTAYRGVTSGRIDGGGMLEVEFEMDMNLGPGLYSLTVALHTGETHTEECYDWVEQAMAFQILPDPLDRFTGLVRLDPSIRMRPASSHAAELEYAHRIAASASAKNGTAD